MGLDVDFYRVKKENVISDYYYIDIDNDDYGDNILYLRKPYKLNDWFLQLLNKRGFVIPTYCKDLLPIRVYKKDYEEFMKELKSGNIHKEKDYIEYYLEQMESIRKYFDDENYAIYYVASW